MFGFMDSEKQTRAALKEVHGALDAVARLVPHYGGCHGLPIRVNGGVELPSKRPCNCPHSTLVRHVAALSRLVNPKARRK